MQRFAFLLDRLALTPSRNAKRALIVDHFRLAGDPARGWALAALTGAIDLPHVKPGTIRRLAETRTDPHLFALSYDYVGDLAETVSLVWPPRPGANRPPPIETVVPALIDAGRGEGERLVETWLDGLDSRGRWALLKLVTGGLRVGVSQRLALVALADYGGVKVTEIEEIWHGLAPPYEDLFAWLDGRAARPAPDIAAPFRPVMLAHPLVPKAQRDDPDAVDPAQITADRFAAEWKYDGVRVQAVAEGGTRRIYTRTGEDISHTFPDILAAMDFEAAIDGELLIRGETGGVAPFNALQQRLNRKTVSKRQMQARPAFILAYDLLVERGKDLRPLPFQARRARLEEFIDARPRERFDLSPLVDIDGVEALDALRRAPPAPEIEGLMLKRWDSPYLAGRIKGHWFKWKRDPFLIDAVLMYAQRGHGKRSSYYSDYTFGVWTQVDGEDRLTPVGKAYFGFSDEELKQLDSFVRDNTVERFGPVRAVTASRDAGLVLEVAFEGLQRSARHKSGLAMRFPRVNRIRWDKPAAEADRLETLAAMLTANA